MTKEEKRIFLIEEVGISEDIVNSTLNIFGDTHENLLLLLSYYTGENSFEDYKKELEEK